MSEHYFKRVLNRARFLIRERKQLLPRVPMEVRHRSVDKHGTRVVIEIDGDVSHHWVCDEGWTEIVNLLNQEFENDRHYSGIELEIPGDWANGSDDHFCKSGEFGSRLSVRRNDHD